MKKDKTNKRTKCAIYTRVMGYMAPVSRYNIGKKSEFYSRKYYKRNGNMEFNKKYSKTLL